MNKTSITLLLLIKFLPIAASAKSTLNENALKEQLQASAISDITFPKTIKTNVSTPIGIRYFKNGDDGPSCALIINKTAVGIFELTSPEPGSDLPACASPIKKPVIFESPTSIFAVFQYSIEDPRNEFTKVFQLLSLSSSGAAVCKNDDKIDDLAKKYIQKNGVRHAYKNAIKQIGCD